MKNVIPFDKHHTDNLKTALRQHLRSKGVLETLIVVRIVLRELSDAMFNNEDSGKTAYTYEEIESGSICFEQCVERYKHM